METRHLGASGLKVSAMGLGCNNFGGFADLEASRGVIHAALDLGITLLDTADGYAGGQSEVVMGQVLGARRKDIVLATKFAVLPGTKVRRADRRHIITALESSLRKLKTDWIDLYQVHYPDPGTPIDETLRALDDLVTSGKVRYIGCSNFPAAQVVDADWTARDGGLHRFVSCQDEYSLLSRDIEAELIPAMRAKGLGLLPFYPLASGMLTGKHRRGQPVAGKRMTMQSQSDRFRTERNFDRVEALEAFAGDRGHTLLELAIGWLLAQPVVSSVIAGATSAEQLKANVAAAGWRLSAEDEAAVRGVLDAV